MPAAIWGIKHKDAHAPFVYEHPAENEKIQLLKNTSCCIPIDAKFDADFKNVYFYMFILSRSRVISQKPPFLSPVASNVQKRWFFVYNSWTTQDKRIKVYIFEISVKFRVDWYATWGVLKKLNFFVSSRMLVHKWRMRIFVLDPPDGGWHFFIKLDHLTKNEGGPAVIWQKWPYCFHPSVNYLS